MLILRKVAAVLKSLKLHVIPWKSFTFNCEGRQITALGKYTFSQLFRVVLHNMTRNRIMYRNYGFTEGYTGHCVYHVTATQTGSHIASNSSWKLLSKLWQGLYSNQNCSAEWKKSFTMAHSHPFNKAPPAHGSGKQ